MFNPSLQTIWGGNLTAVFCDTGWEHPDTYKHVNDVCLQMGVRLITLKSKYDFVSLAVHKKRFPSTNARFCTSNVWFCMDGYIYDTYKGNPIYSSMSSIPPSWEPIAWMPKPKFEE